MNKFSFLSFKWPDAKVDAHYDVDLKEVVIDNWVHPSLPKPTRDQMAQAEVEFAADRVVKKGERSQRKIGVLQKMGLNSGDIPALIELLQDGNIE